MEEYGNITRIRRAAKIQSALLMMLTGVRTKTQDKRMQFFFCNQQSISVTT